MVTYRYWQVSGDMSYRRLTTMELPEDISNIDVAGEIVGQGVLRGPDTDLDVEWDGDTAIVYNSENVVIAELRPVSKE